MFNIYLCFIIFLKKHFTLKYEVQTIYKDLETIKLQYKYIIYMYVYYSLVPLLVINVLRYLY